MLPEVDLSICDHKPFDTITWEKPRATFRDPSRTFGSWKMEPPSSADAELNLKDYQSSARISISLAPCALGTIHFGPPSKSQPLMYIFFEQDFVFPFLIISLVLLIFYSRNIDLLNSSDFLFVNFSLSLGLPSWPLSLFYTCTAIGHRAASVVLRPWIWRPSTSS